MTECFPLFNFNCYTSFYLWFQCKHSSAYLPFEMFSQDPYSLASLKTLRLLKDWVMKRQGLLELAVSPTINTLKSQKLRSWLLILSQFFTFWSNFDTNPACCLPSLSATNYCLKNISVVLLHHLLFSLWQTIWFFDLMDSRS